jgi:AraC-like DNA-binding protein
MTVVAFTATIASLQRAFYATREASNIVSHRTDFPYHLCFNYYPVALLLPARRSCLIAARTSTEGKKGARVPTPSEVIKRVILAESPPTFPALARLAALRTGTACNYTHPGLADEYDPSTLGRALAALHTELFLEWICLALEAQKEEVKAHLVAGIGGLAVESGLGSQDFLGFAPDSAERLERLIFEDDLELIFLLLHAERTNAQSSVARGSSPRRVASALSRVKTSFGNIQLTLKGLSRSAGVSEGHLGRMIRRQLGVPFRQYLTAVRMCDAERLLRSSPRSFKEIAAVLGYKDTCNFSRDFLKAFGISPKAYRRQIPVQ